MVFSDELYADYVHSIDEVEEDVIDETIVNSEAANVKLGDRLPRSERISLTMRYVPTVEDRKREREAEQLSKQ